MSHHTAFVITNEVLQGRRVPSDTELRRAAAEAQESATNMAQALGPEDNGQPYPETLAIGGNTYRFIQGNEDTNLDTFAGMPRDQWPRTTHEFWSQRSGTCAQAHEAPAEILGWSWNSSDLLITLALESNPRRRRIYPSLLLVPDRDLPLHCLSYHDEDVFGDPAPGGSAALYLEGDPVMAWHRAKSPLQELAEANFRVEYLRTLHRHPNRLVMELDWNL